MTDIRWSDDARVTFPDNPSSLVEVFSGILISDVSNKLSNDLPDQYLND